MFKFESKIDKLIAAQCVLFAIGWLTYVDVVDKINEMTNGAFYRTAEQEWKRNSGLADIADVSPFVTREEKQMRKMLNDQRKYLVEELRR